MNPRRKETALEVHDSIAVVTGAASGLGLATATQLTNAGATVVLIDLPQSPGEQMARERGGHFVPADVTDESDMARAIELASSLGDLRIVVNCAGIVTGKRLYGRSGAVPLADFERVIRVNLLGTVNVMRLALGAMQAAPVLGEERGVIVNTASVAAFDGQIGQTAYAASKAAVAGMTLPAARELADTQIRVVAIAPGTFETPMMAGMTEEVRRSLGDQVPHPRRLGRPAEFASLVEHIIANPMLNGEVIRLDGAIRMAPR